MKTHESIFPAIHVLEFSRHLELTIRTLGQLIHRSKIRLKLSLKIGLTGSGSASHAP